MQNRRNKQTSQRVLRPGVLSKKLDISEGSLRTLAKQSGFPKPFVIIPGGRAIGWLESEIDLWIEKQSKEAL